MNIKTSDSTHHRSRLTMGDKIRNIADQLQQETQIQVKATARILGAAAQITENHDRLIDEVTSMVNQDLDLLESTQQSSEHTVENLKKSYKTLKKAKEVLGLKAKSWNDLLKKLNAQKIAHNSQNPSLISQLLIFAERLTKAEKEIQLIRSDLHDILSFLEKTNSP